MFQHEIHQCTCLLNVEHVITLSTRCFPHHWSVQIEACPLLSAHPSSHGHILSSTLILMKGRLCLPPLRVLLLCNHVCSMTLIRPNQSGTRDHDPLWAAALVSMSRGLFYGPFELRCFYDSHWWSAWDCAHIVIFLNCLMMYNFLQVL